MFDISFEMIEGEPVYWVSNFKVHSGDEVKILIHHDDNEGECWTAFCEVLSPSYTEAFCFGETLGCRNQKTVIEAGLNVNRVTVSSEELEIITKRTVEVVTRSWPTHSAADSFFGAR